MLRELSVQNLALIEDLRVELEAGFCAWTGETGAGKTLLLQALGLLLGERGSSELLREGAEELRIAGRFEIENTELRRAVEEILQRPLDDEQLLLMRRLSAQGRSFAYVNDQPVTLAMLKNLGTVLVDLHGQRESQALLDAGYQLRMLDAFGGLETLREDYVRWAGEVRELRRQIAALDTDRQKRLRELNLVRFEMEEIDAAHLVPGELAELTQEREKLVHAQALFDFAHGACNRLYDEDGAFYEVLGRMQRDAEHYAKIDPELIDVHRRLMELTAETQDLAQTLRAWTQTSQADPERIEEVESRLQLLRRLEKKYARTIDEIIVYRLSLDAQLAELEGQEEDRETLEAKLADAFAGLREAGAKLSRERTKAARKFASLVQKELAELSMPDAKLEASLEAIELGNDPLQAEVPGQGLERLELMLAANAGEAARPLRKVASGGEMSRTMLALKTVLAGKNRVGTMIFDEIDANVGGRLGDVLGAKLGQLGKSNQVICVTHLPQVASYAPHQWSIRKTKKGKRTVTTIEPLTEPERLEELAHMLRGASRGETTRKEAEAMLQAAKKKW
jgi:DNA repair protein RecN (Recombination protein N)